ncbi:MAG: hypothetical protein CL946_10475 [Ectothiorhodospiraceae bacterium]|nr:hypothetical protein [Ectothiorhodospiraceae bacterium]
MIPFIFFGLFIPLLGVYILFLVRIRQGIKYYQNHPEQPQTSTDERPTVSVIVPMRDEERHVAQLVESLAAQQYPDDKYEILLIDDGSTDATSERATESIKGHPQFRIIQLGDEGGSKKRAIQAGIHESTGEVILTTDADCRHTPGWIASMVAALGRENAVIAGPVIVGDRETLFHRIQAMEFLSLMGVGAGFFGIGYPRLCNGANLCYRKSAYEAADGFAGNEHVSSGDDEFLMHKIVYREGGQAEFNHDQDAIVTTPPADAVGAFLQQRIRWASKGRHYEDKRFVSFLVLLFVFEVFVAAMPLVAIFSPIAFFVTVILLMTKYSVDFMILTDSAILLKQPIRFGDFLLAELLHPFYLVSVSILGAVNGTTWKGRRINSRK